VTRVHLDESIARLEDAAADRVREADEGAERGHNFLLTMLRLGAERPELTVVDDQRGAPTWARDIAAATVQVLTDPPNGLYHLTAGGATTWHGFACEIMRRMGLTPAVRPIRSAEYPTAARRPANSILDNTRLREAAGIVMPLWDASLAKCLAEIQRTPT